MSPPKKKQDTAQDKNSFLERVEELTRNTRTDEETRLLKELIQQGRTPFQVDPIEIPLIPVIARLPAKYLFPDMHLPLPPMKGQFKKVWQKLTKLGAKEEKLDEILTRYPLPDISIIFQAIEKKGQEISRISLKSKRRYRSLKTLIENDSGFSARTKEIILKEIDENIEVSDFVSNNFSYRHFKKHLKRIGLDKQASMKPEKHRVWSSTILELANYIKAFCGTEKETFENIAILLKAFHPTIWKDSVPVIAARIKSRFYNAL